MQVHIAGNRAYFRAEAGNLVCKHARCWNLDRVVPIVVVVTKSVGKVQNRHLRDVTRILSDIEMRRLDGTLRYRVGHKEEIEFAINNLALFNETLINVGTLWWVVDQGLVLRILRLLEETLTYALVDDNQSDLRTLGLI